MDQALNINSIQKNGYRPRPFESPYDISDFDIELGIFSININYEDNVLKLKVRLGFKPISYEWDAFTLDLLNPSVTLTLPSTKILGASITLSINDATGEFKASASWSTLFWSDSASIELSILDPYHFGLKAVGVAADGIKKYAEEIALNHVSHELVTGFGSLVDKNASAVDVNPEEVFNLMKEQPDMAKAVLSHLKKGSKSDLEEIGAVSTMDFETGLAAVVHDERIQHLYPGIEEKFEFSPEVLRRIENYPFVKVEDFSEVSADNVLEYIRDILIGFTAWLGISITALGIVVGLIAALIGVAALTGPGVVVVALFLIVLLQVLGPLCLLIWVAASIAIVAYLIIDGFVRFSTLEELIQSSYLEHNGN